MSRPASSGVRFPPPLAYILGLALGITLSHFSPGPLLPAPARWLVGTALVVAGLAFSLSAVVTFVRARTPVNPRSPTTKLVTSGPFALTRNPMYAGLAVAYLGGAALANSLWSVVLLLVVLVVIRRAVIEREERYLARAFGDEYAAYAARVRRWI